MSEFLQSGQHPDADQLSAFLEHMLPAHEQEQTLAHLAVCAHCRSVVALSLPPLEEAKPQAEIIRRPWRSGWNRAWLPAAGLAALILVGISLRNSSLVQHPVPPAQVALSTPAAVVEQAPPPPVPQPTARLAAPPSESAAEQDSGKIARGSFRGPGEISKRSTETAAGALDRARSTDYAALHSTAGAAQAGGVMGGTLGSLATTNQAVNGPDRHPLPSGLPALSTVANNDRAIAIDAQNTLFFSEDAGAHWHAVAPQWQGRAVKVELVTSRTHQRVRNDIAVAARPEASAPVKPALGVLGGIVSRESLVEKPSSLSGEVTDASGATIADASVVVTNSLTQVAHTTKTDPQGHYVVDGLDPGSYTLEAAAPGFNPQKVPGISLTPAAQDQRNLSLAVGSASETVEISAQNQPLPSATSRKATIAATGGPVSPPRSFVITTDTGEHWTSTDGRTWSHAIENSLPAAEK